MRKTDVVRYRMLCLIEAVLIFMVGMISLNGCGNVDDSTAVLPDNSYPSFENLLEEKEEFSHISSPISNVIPVRIYFDNTGSMEGFTIDGEGKRKPCALYAKLIRCLRDMGRMQTAEYYILDVNAQDWALYGESLYDNFYAEGFYIWWKSGQPGPLSKLYMDNMIDEKHINIVMTDLAEQYLNNTQLAEQIQKLCNEKNCEADLFAFKFDFNGATQVPNPNAISGMLNESIHDKKPYYMLITGPSGYMEKYRKELKTLLHDSGMEEGEDYFWVTNHSEAKNEYLTIKDVVYEPFADYEQIRMESESQRRAEKNSGEEEDKNDLGTYSKNLCRYENTEQICASIEFDAFYYQKVEGVSKSQSDWRLNFYIPLNDFENPQLEYTYEYHIYKIERPQIEAESELDLEQQPNVATGNWVEDVNPRIELSMDVCENFERNGEQYPAVLYISCKDKDVEKEHLPRNQELLLLIDISKEEIASYNRPEWLSEFDTGNTDDYFTRTFNLNGFYDVLFGNKSEISGDGAIHIQSNYAQIPIVLTGLKE